MDLGEMLMAWDGAERRIAMLRKSIEARHSPTEREYRSGAVKFSDVIIELMAYLKKEQSSNKESPARSRNAPSQNAEAEGTATPEGKGVSDGRNRVSKEEG